MFEWQVIARREFIERVRTRWFVVVTVLGPVAMMALLIVPAWLAARSAEEKVVVEVVDRTGRNLVDDLKLPLAIHNVSLAPAPSDDQAVLLRRIRDKQINGFLELPSNLVQGNPATYRGDNATNFGFRIVLTEALRAVVREIRARDAGIPEAKVREIEGAPVQLIAVHDTGTGETKSPQASFAAGIAVMFLVYFAILFYAINVMRSVLQEKTSRVVEIIVSAVRPSSLMLGKVIGVGGVGLLQFAIWAAVGLLLVGFRVEILGVFGIAESKLDVPPLDLIDVLVVLADFVVGYFFYAALYAAVGAMVNSDQEAQQVQMPLMALIIIPMLCISPVLNNPRGVTAQVLTLFPFTSPVMMPMRYLLGGMTPVDVLLSFLILLASTAAAVAVAGRIYRVGILMYGKRPSLSELLRWIRHT